MTYETLHTFSRPTLPQELTSGAKRVASGRPAEGETAPFARTGTNANADTEARVGRDASAGRQAGAATYAGANEYTATGTYADTSAHQAPRRPVSGAGPAGRARHRSGVRPGGAAGTSPGTALGARHGRRRRLARGAEVEVAAVSRLRADALMAGGRSPTGRGTNTEGTPPAEPEPGRGSEPGRGREAPSWAVGPETRTRPDAVTAPGPTAAASRSAVISEPGTSAVSRSVGIGAAGTFAPPRPAGTSAVGQGRWREAGTALRDRLPLWVQLRCGLEPRALIALAVVLAGAAVLATTHFWSARPEVVRAPERVAEAAAVQAAGSGVSGAQGPGTSSGPSAGSSAPSAQGGRIVVDVSGKVRRPGIQHLPAGSRVADALKAAGGVREGADLTGLNRARVLTDGEQVLVGLPAAQPPPGGGSPGTGQAGSSAPLSLGTATVEQLETLPGVGPVLAQHILDYRTEHGGYRSVDELREVNGIGDRRFADLRALVTP